MKRILVIRACAIGDFILNLPALRALNVAHPDSRFTLVGYPRNLELARDFLPVEGIHSIENEPWSQLFHKPLMGLSFDDAIVWMRDQVVAENLRASGLYNVIHAVPFPAYGHAATHLLRTLGLPEPLLPDIWRQGNDDIIIHESSGSSRKNWPYFRALKSRLGRACLFLCETPFEGRMEVTDRMLSGLSLTEVSRHLRSCRAFVGNDSGITHLAAYLGCPTIAIFGPTDPRVWGPIGRRTRIVWKTNLEDISADEILLALECRT